MINTRDVDRAIDVAASLMMTREPSRWLGSAVMTRVREGEARAPRRFVWATAAAGVVLCGVLATALLSRVPAQPLPHAARLDVGLPPVAPRVPNTVVADAVPTRSVIRDLRSGDRVPTRTPLPQSDVSPIDPIRTEPIVLSPIDVVQLDLEATGIDTLTIEPLTIEPLATSND